MLKLAAEMEIAETKSIRQTNRKIRGGNGETPSEADCHVFSATPKDSASLEEINPEDLPATAGPTLSHSSGGMTPAPVTLLPTPITLDRDAITISTSNLAHSGLHTINK